MLSVAPNDVIVYLPAWLLRDRSGSVPWREFTCGWTAGGFGIRDKTSPEKSRHMPQAASGAQTRPDKEGVLLTSDDGWRNGRGRLAVVFTQYPRSLCSSTVSSFNKIWKWRCRLEWKNGSGVCSITWTETKKWPVK